MRLILAAMVMTVLGGSAAAQSATTSSSTYSVACYESAGICERLEAIERRLASIQPAPPPPVAIATRQPIFIYGDYIEGLQCGQAGAGCDTAAATFCRTFGYSHGRVTQMSTNPNAQRYAGGVVCFTP